MNNKELWNLLETSDNGAILRYIIMEINYLIKARDFNQKKLFKYLNNMVNKISD